MSSTPDPVMTDGRAAAPTATAPAPTVRSDQRTEGRSRPELTVLVLTGTSEHPFDRLVRWVDRWYGDHAAAGRDLRVTI